jgi:hypothetical protein
MKFQSVSNPYHYFASVWHSEVWEHDYEVLLYFRARDGIRPLIKALELAIEDDSQFVHRHRNGKVTMIWENPWYKRREDDWPHRKEDS